MVTRVEGARYTRAGSRSCKIQGPCYRSNIASISLQAREASESIRGCEGRIDGGSLAALVMESRHLAVLIPRAVPVVMVGALTFKS